MDGVRLSGLVSSRICHDLIGPLGAIGNGVELLEETGAGAEEMRLIADCAATVAATLRFHRIAFGARDPGETIGREELGAIAAAHLAPRRITLDWGAAPAEIRFRAAQPLLLLALVAAGALTRGGALSLTEVEDDPLRLAWRLSGEATALRDRHRGLIAHRPDPDEIDPAEAHFLLLWSAAEAAGARPYWREEGVIGMS